MVSEEDKMTISVRNELHFIVNFKCILSLRSLANSTTYKNHIIARRKKLLYIILLVRVLFIANIETLLLLFYDSDEELVSIKT